MIHHLAVAVKELKRSHDFYTEAMGFKLVKVVKGVAPGDRGWGRHLFYDSGHGQLFAIWDLHLNDFGPEDWGEGGTSRGLGLPWWVNHVSFQCADEVEFNAKLQRWLDHGLKVREVDHDFIRSIYTFDPDGTLIEWCYRTRQLNAADEEEAWRLFGDDSPPTQTETWEPKIHLPEAKSVPVS